MYRRRQSIEVSSNRTSKLSREHPFVIGDSLGFDRRWWNLSLVFDVLKLTIQFYPSRSEGRQAAELWLCRFLEMNPYTSTKGFTARKRHATSSESNHPHFPCIPNLRRKFSSENFIRNCYFVEYASTGLFPTKLQS